MQNKNRNSIIIITLLMKKHAEMKHLCWWIHLNTFPLHMSYACLKLLNLKEFILLTYCYQFRPRNHAESIAVMRSNLIKQLLQCCDMCNKTCVCLSYKLSIPSCLFCIYSLNLYYFFALILQEIIRYIISKRYILIFNLF